MGWAKRLASGRANFDWTAANTMIANKSTERVKKAAEVIKEAAKRRCPVGTIDRPMYRTGIHSGEPYTARDAGQLKRSLRVVERNTEKFGFAFQTFKGLEYGNIRVYAGDFLAYYARITEYYKPWFRPAVEKTKSAVKRILEYG